MSCFKSDAELAHIARGLIGRTLPKREWTHAAHFAAALWILARCPELDAERDMPGLIRAYNEATGVANTDSGGYHKTITLASIRAARAFLAASEGMELFEIANALLASPLGHPDWLHKYWSPSVLFTPAARRTYIPPDREKIALLV